MAGNQDKDSNYALFRECFSAALLERMARPAKKKPKRRANRRKSGISSNTDNEAKEQEGEGGGRTDQEELADFIEFLASEIFPSLPEELRKLSYTDAEASPSSVEQWKSLTAGEVEERLLPTLPASVEESVSAYALLSSPPSSSLSTSLATLLATAIESYAASLTAPPPVWSATRTDECEVCGRDWIPLSYHHLVPRSVHDKARRRGWHAERDLNKVAWLCRACHNFVHRAADNETLARHYHTVDALLERQDVQDWAKWVSRVRWKAR